MFFIEESDHEEDKVQAFLKTDIEDVKEKRKRDLQELEEKTLNKIVKSQTIFKNPLNLDDSDYNPHYYKGAIDSDAKRSNLD